MLTRVHLVLTVAISTTLLLVAGLLGGVASAAVTQQSFATGRSALPAGNTTLTIPQPAGLAVGDFMLAQIAFQRGQGAGTDAQLTPAGWTLVRRTNQGNDLGQAVFYRFATASDVAASGFTFPFNVVVRAAGGIVRYTGVDPTGPIVASSGGSDGDHTLTAPGVTAEADSLLIALFSFKKVDTVLSVPAGMTSQYTTHNFVDLTILAAEELRPTAGATGTRVSTPSPRSNDKWVAQLVVLRMAPPPCVAAAVTDHPSNQSITYGDSAQFTIVPSGTPTPTVTWQRSTDAGMSWSDVPGATTSTLGVTPLVADSGSRYRAVATNTCNGARTAESDAATLIVAPRAASVTPADASKAFGAADPDPLTTGTLAGFLAADAVGATYSRVAGEDLGTPYTISATLTPADVLANYDITSNTATFTISWTWADYGTFQITPYCGEGAWTHEIVFVPAEGFTGTIPAGALSVSVDDGAPVAIGTPLIRGVDGYNSLLVEGTPGGVLQLFALGIADPIAVSDGSTCPEEPTCGVGDLPACPQAPTCGVDGLPACDLPPVTNNNPPEPVVLPPAEEPVDPVDPPLPPAQEEGLDPVRVGGGDRIETSVLVSQSLFGDGGAGAVVLARADVPADAIASTPFSVALDAPVLLTGSETLDSRVRAEILRVLEPGGVVYIAGGERAISPAVAGELQGLGLQTERISGANRFSTATELADRLYGFTSFTAAYSRVAGTMVLLADGSGYRDATVAGPAAANVAGAVLLTDGERMPAETATWLAANPVMSVVAVGQLAGSASPGIEQVGSADPFITSTAVADRFFSRPTVVGLATHEAFPDPLVGGVDIAHRGGPLLLTRSDVLPATVAAWAATNQATLTDVRIYGGVLAVTDAVADAMRAAMSR